MKNYFEQIPKYSLLIFFFFIYNLSNAQDCKSVITNALTNESLKARGIIKKEDDGAFRLDYDDVYEEDAHAKFLQSKGFHGGGPSWLGIIHGAFSMCENSLTANLDSDVSVTGVSYWSENVKDLEKIARVIAAIKSDEKILLQVIEIAKQQDMML